MASRRMFSKDVVCSDRFLDMPASAQTFDFSVYRNCLEVGKISK